MTDYGQPQVPNVPDATVDIQPHDPQWHALFEEERVALQEALAGVALAVEHIGSTAVPGLAAKPTIDILAVVTSLDACLQRLPRLQELGYDYRPRSFVAGEDHLFLRKVAPTGKRTHHLHVLTEDSPRVADYLRFRDYLRQHPEEAAQYANVKLDLARRFAENRMRYVDEKSKYVDVLITRVREWKG